MVDLDHKFPIIFFPIRIETKYHHSTNENISVLRLRFFPDQVSIDNFDPRLARKEIEDARDYWRILATLDPTNPDAFNQDRNSAWTELANKYGLPRAAYITKAVINYDPDSESDPTSPSLKTDDNIEIRDEGDNFSPVCRLLPNRFIVHGKFKDLTLGSIEQIGETIPKSLSLDPLQNIENIENIETIGSPNWVTDFEVALKTGMAIELKLSNQQYKSGFEYIIVYGVREDLSPEQTKKEIENLFTAHRYSDGLSFVKQGTPTNLVKEKSKDGQYFFSPHSFTQSDVNTYRSVEFATLQEKRPGLITDHAPDGRIFDWALGLDHVANGLLNANNNDQLTATSMSSALWSPVLGYFMRRFVNAQSLGLDNLENHFVRYVSAQGFVPPIRVGKTPYGILPVTILSDWEDISIVGGTNHIRNFFAFLKTRWARFVNEVPTVMNKTNDPTQNLLNILSMEALSHSYYVRGVRYLLYVSDFIFHVLNIKTAAGMPIVSLTDLVVKNKILLNILLKITFPIIPVGILDRFYDICPGNGITGIEFPMVSVSEKGDALDPNYIRKIHDDVMGPAKNFLKTTKEQLEIADIAPSDSDPLLFRLLRYSASIIGKIGDQGEIDKFAESLQPLRDIKPDRLKTLMLQTLDLVSYRLDAWISSLANQRLDHLRQSTGKGLHVGAFGWVENLMPKDFQNGISTKNSISAGGYIHAPSYAHAGTAAVLRNGYLTHSNESDKKDLLKINLNSERTKSALEIINGIGNTPLSELLGYRLERRLHDAGIDYLIDEFRKYFPLNKDDYKQLADTSNPGQERIEPRNLTDGLSVFRNWKRLTDSISSSTSENIKNFMESDVQVPGWKSFYFEIRSKYAAQDVKMIELINRFKPQLNFLLDQMDGLSDLCLAESVFQAINGNYLRSGAVMDGMSGDGQIPIPEISAIPRSGPRQVQRVALAFEVEPLETLTLHDVHDILPWVTPKRIAEPNFSNLLKSYIEEISFWLDLKDESGNITSTEELGLTDLGLEAVDLLYIENSELDARLNYYGKTKGINNFHIRYEQKETPSIPTGEIERRSLTDVQFLIKALQGMVAQGQPLKYSDFISPQEMIQRDVLLGGVKEIFQRYYDIVILLVQTLRELELARSDDTETGIENKRQALIRAGFFANEFAVPITVEGNVMKSVSELNERIILAIERLKSRLPQGDDQATKLSGWRSKLETDGEELFLESITDELSGEPENSNKYLKTIEMVAEQIKSILNIKTFLILPPFSIPLEPFTKLRSSAPMDRKVLKWIEKASYVRPRLRFLDDIIIHNQILESANFSFYCDETKFMKGAEILSSNNEEMNPTSIILAVSIEPGEQERSFPSDPSKNLAGVVADEWTDKIVSKEQDTYITFHYDGPNTEAPQSLLLAVSPNDLHKWNEGTILKVILESLELMKLRAVDYRSLKELRHFLPALLLNSYGENTFINLFQRRNE